VAHREELRKKLLTAQDTGDASIARIQVGNATGLISGVEPAANIVRRIIEEAEAILRSRPQTLLRN
jgi:NAD(P)H-dependent flavin oxidoreductase YrpB (nitropropane dioxygenase family)